jgi:leucyl-tRNA---protein transferase
MVGETMRTQFNVYPQPNLYLTLPRPCGYLPDKTAVTVFADPLRRKDKELYSVLCRQGFRRSGDVLYRPHCPHCRACISVRVPVANFSPSRTQRRIWHKNQDLQVIPTAPVYNESHFQLYQRYIASRHQGAGMDNPEPADYLQFLTTQWSDTFFYEIRLDKQLIAVAVVDGVEDGLSAVYTFFEPSLPQRSLGVYAVLWEIAETKRQGLKYLYLGYWIEECRKMSYKNQYQPLEGFIDGEWRFLSAND